MENYLVGCRFTSIKNAIKLLLELMTDDKIYLVMGVRSEFYTTGG